MSTILDMCRKNLEKARTELISGSKRKAADRHLDVSKLCDQVISGKIPSDEEEAKEFQLGKERLNEHFQKKYVHFIRQVDLQRSVELKGWD